MGIRIELRVQSEFVVGGVGEFNLSRSRLLSVNGAWGRLVRKVSQCSELAHGSCSRALLLPTASVRYTRAAIAVRSIAGTANP